MISIDYKALEEALSSKPARKCYRPPKVSECDGGGAAAGGAGAGGAGGGDAGGVVGGGEVASVADVAGTSSTDVLGKCDHSHGGYLGAGCFHVPAKC